MSTTKPEVSAKLEAMHQELAVNTDISLIDADWDDFEALHKQRYGLVIAYLKSVVEGVSYANKVMELVVGERGFYAQAKNFPAAFYGELGRATIDVVTEAEARAAVWEATALYRADEAQSLTCIYGAESPGDIFFGYRLGSTERYELGHIQLGLPLHLRVVVDAPQITSLLGKEQGVLIYQRGMKGEHLLLSAPGRRQPFPFFDGFRE